MTIKLFVFICVCVSKKRQYERKFSQQCYRKWGATKLNMTCILNHLKRALCTDIDIYIRAQLDALKRTNISIHVWYIYLYIYIIYVYHICGYVWNSIVCALTLKTKIIKTKAIFFSQIHLSYCFICMYIQM